MNCAASNAGSAERVLVVGGGLGGLSAAIHLCLAGRPVTLLEAQPRVGGRASRIASEGFTFDTGPSLLNYPWVFEELFAAAGRRLADAVELCPVDPGVTFRWPDGTGLELSTDLDRLRASLERIETGAGERLWAFLADAERKYAFSFQKLVTRNARNPLTWFGRLTPGEMWATSAWRSLYAELGRFFRSPHIREALGSYAMYLGGSPWALPGLFSILPYGELAYGLWLPRGGMYALVEAIERLALDLGAEIRTGCPVASIHVEGGSVRGVELAGGGFEAASRIVSNVDVPVTRARLLSDPALRAAGARRNRRVRMTPGVVSFYWGLRACPRGLGHHTIFLPADVRGSYRDLTERGRIPAALPFYTSAPSRTDPDLAPPGHTALFVLVPTPPLSALGPVDWPRETAALRARVLERLAAEGLALDPADFVCEHVWTPADWGERFGLHDGSAFGAAHTLFQMGPFRDPNRDPRVRGLYYVGAGTTPGTGVPMVTLGGAMTAEQVLTDAC